METQTYENMTDADVEEMIEDISSQGKNVALGVPISKSLVVAFFDLFRCARCGKCCLGIGTTGGIALLPEEVRVLAKVKGISYRKFKDQYTAVREAHRFLNYPCLFYDSGNHKCSIYDKRPFVCRVYPIAEPYRNLLLGQEYLFSLDPSCLEAKRIAISLVKKQKSIYQAFLGESSRR